MIKIDEKLPVGNVLKESPRVGPGASERPARVQSFSEGIFHISRECFVG
jgi:hypothetical protein